MMSRDGFVKHFFKKRKDGIFQSSEFFSLTETFRQILHWKFS